MAAEPKTEPGKQVDTSARESARDEGKSDPVRAEERGLDSALWTQMGIRKLALRRSETRQKISAEKCPNRNKRLDLLQIPRGTRAAPTEYKKLIFSIQDSNKITTKIHRSPHSLPHLIIKIKI
jgi:hypothetical protein